MFLKKILVIILALCSMSCKAQLLVNEKSDAPKLLKNKGKFIDKPLENLLKQIGPRINSVMASPSEYSHIQLGYFTFFFAEKKAIDSLSKQNKRPVRITVFVKESFEWDRLNWPIKERLIWTKEDAKKYGSLTVVDIRVSGDQ